MLYIKFKRVMDFIISFIGLIILFPLFLIVSFAIKIESKGPVFFKQKRLGKNGKEFVIYKFRSMHDGTEKSGSGHYSFEGDPRVTKVGKIIRATSIDELPQFINILKGDMAIIGPRPTLIFHPYLYKDYSNTQKRRFEVLPGVTGLAQINGRKNISWDDRILFDIEYVQNISLILDIKIIFKTFIKVILNKNNINTIKTVEKDK